MKESLLSIADKTINATSKNNIRQVAKAVWFMLLSQKKKSSRNKIIVINEGKNTISQKKLSSLNKFIEIMEEKSSISQGRLRANITCTRALSNIELSEIKTKLERVYRAPVDISIKTDRNILGGFKIKIADEIIDLSWQGKLNSLKLKLGA